MIQKNGLLLHEVNSEILLIKEISDIKKTSCEYFSSDGFAVAYLSYGVFVGKYKEGDFEFFKELDLNSEAKHILKLRVFNEEKELYIWRNGDVLKGRVRIDSGGIPTAVVDASQVLWGRKKEKIGKGWTKVFEERGTELVLPFQNIDLNGREKRIFLRSRNYINFHPPSYLASYVDCRFMGFFDNNEKPLE